MGSVARMSACASAADAAAWTETLGLTSAENVAICATAHTVTGTSGPCSHSGRT